MALESKEGVPSTAEQHVEYAEPATYENSEQAPVTSKTWLVIMASEKTLFGDETAEIC